MARHELVTPWDDPSEDRDRRSSTGTYKERYTLPQMANTARPMTPTQALMEAEPHEEPDVSQLELLGIRDVLADAIEALAPLERRLVEARLIERRPLRSLEKEFGLTKSTLQRHERRLVQQLQEQLAGHPIIAARLREEE